MSGPSDAAIADERDAARAPADSDLRVAEHEAAAHQKRNWVRLTYQCNDRCVFCLDAQTHDGTNRDRDSIKGQILEGRRAGAQRLILSGGEPTIHPDFIAFVRLGTLAGYERVQTVTNGRMFAYREFLTRAVDAGLGEITFSIHGPNARIHDALVGVKGAWDEEIEGLKHALADGRPIVNIDVCVNRANVQHLPEMLETFYGMGVREFDLLQIIPFGRAFVEGKDTLFYDLEDAREPLERALAWSERPDVHLWMNRFPVEHLEGYEALIQDPYKLQDEVRGRKEEYGLLIDHGVALDCRQPERCRYCYVSRLCDHLDDTRAALAENRFDVVRIDTEWEAEQPPVYGGDPASAKRGLVVLGTTRPQARSLAERIEAAAPSTLWIVAPDVQAARAVARAHPSVEHLELELDDDTGLAEDGLLEGRPIVTAHAKSPAQAERLLAIDGLHVTVHLHRGTAAWLTDTALPEGRVTIVQPTHERLTESAEHDVDLRELFARLSSRVPVVGVPACIVQQRPEGPFVAPGRRVLDAAQLQPDGRLEIFRYTRRFIDAHYRVKSRRCRTCRHAADCDGLHVNYVRAHGFGAMQPVPADDADTDAATTE